MADRQILISDPDLEAAHRHLAAQPYSKAASMPECWSRQHVLNLVAGAIGDAPKPDCLYPVASGLWALVKPVGIDIVDWPAHDSRLQVWLLVRPANTDPASLTEITSACRGYT